MNRSRPSLRPVLCLIAGLLAVLTVSVYRQREAAARLIPLNGNAYNKTTNPPTNDLWCNGGQIAGNVVKAYTEVCQDYTGSLLPTATLGTQNLGSSPLPWKNEFISGQTVLTAYTTTQISVLVPVAGAGQTATVSVVNGNGDYSTCASTGTNAGAWVYMSSSTLAVCK